VVEPSQPKMSGAGQDRCDLRYTSIRTRQQGSISGAFLAAARKSAIMSCSVQGLNKELPAAKQAPSLALSTTVRETARRKVELAGVELGLLLAYWYDSRQDCIFDAAVNVHSLA